MSDDLRIGDLLRSEPTAETRLVLVGFPSDEGVRRNGGRRGAAAGPAEIRRHLLRYTPDARSGGRHRALWERAADVGDVACDRDLDAAQERLGEVVAEHLERGRRVVVLGGGHETAYGHFLGYARRRAEVSVVNLDAHPDVRPLVAAGGHSGSPFRQALEHESGVCRGYAVIGLQPQAVAESHWRYLEDRHCSVLWRRETEADSVDRILGEATARGECLVTLDLDAVEAAAAPGVSAPSPGGVPAAWLLAAARAAGRRSEVRSLDVCELNPRFDPDGRTARLAAQAVWWFSVGVSESST